jgi:hypothetical protein
MFIDTQQSMTSSPSSDATMFDDEWGKSIDVSSLNADLGLLNDLAAIGIDDNAVCDDDIPEENPGKMRSWTRCS